MIFAKCYLLILGLVCGSHAYKILVYYPTPSYSHQRAILALTERLVKDGHELFVISPNAVPGLSHHENYTFVDLSYSYKYFSEGDTDDTVNLQRPWSKWELPKVFEPSYELTKNQLRTDNFLRFKQFVKSKRIKFDLVIGESFYTPYTCGLTRILTGAAPIITMITLTADYSSEDNLGSITHLSYVPSHFDHYGYTSRMTLWQKIENWFSDYYLVSGFKERMESAARSYFSETEGSESEKLLDGCWKNISLALVTSNPLYFYPRALGPNVIEVGPLHIKTPQKLPKNLQTWLDGAEKGAIYFSLGSNMKSKSLAGDVRANFLKFFKELPPGYRVLWKWELDGEIPGQSENILAQKWFPQDSVLAHPNVKVFIMQGGVQSFQEAVHFGVPIIGIPWYGDQYINTAKMVDAEIGVRLLPKELHSYDKIKSALEAVLYDEKYLRNMKRHSRISHDFTSRGMDQAVFWVNHVAKHGGASHLRPATADTTLFQYFCLDILSVIIVLSFSVLLSLYYLCKAAFSFALRKLESKLKSSERRAGSFSHKNK
nr:PREDICTED: UDP-glucuronosyltransferase 2B18-like [Bemisia tabaci]